VNDALRDHLVDAFRERSVPAVAPCRLPSWRVEETETVGVASTWSERHACHAAGLGTFGLCDGLITRRGKAMRCGSVLVAIDLPPTPRADASPYAWCLFYAKGACGACVRRCPVEAITEKGHDKMRCQAHLYGTVNAYAQKTLGLVSYGCGLCQTRVPCEGGIPPGLEQTGEGES
jgi:epoxyqueuosine reductase QueG